MSSIKFHKFTLTTFLVIIFFTVSFGYEANAQRTNFPSGKQSIQTYKDFFNRNLQYLSDVEGIYDVSMIPKYSGGNLLSGVRHWGGQELGTTAVIYKNTSDTYTCKFILDVDDQIDRWHLGKPFFTLTPLTTESNVFRIEGTYNETYSHFGNSGQLVFTISTRTIWDRGIIEFEFSGNDKFHMVNAEVSMVKTYPTPSQLNGANLQQPQQPSNVTEEWSGTGFALKNGYIVTNYHVVEGAASITIQGVKGDFNTKYSATIVGTDKINDLALLKISDLNFLDFGTLPYTITSTTSEAGEEIFVLGYPLTSTMGDEIKLTTGIISSKTGYQGDVALYQISAPIQPGNSGGPLFDKKGNVIGVVSAKHAGAENVGYAIKSTYLKNLVESCASASILPTLNSVASLSLPNKVKRVKDFVFYIKCSSSVNSQAYGQNTRIINNPTCISKPGDNFVIERIVISPSNTVLECSSKNDLYNGWMSIDRFAYIKVSGREYSLQSTDGIAIYPKVTDFAYPGQILKFKLIFPPIPNTSKSLDFIESDDSKWKVYGVSLR